MTIAIAIKVNDGIVLATDSRSSIIDRRANGSWAVLHAYDHANKTVNLYKGLPIGVVTSGIGTIGYRSIATIAKEFRELLTGDTRPDWKLDPSAYTIDHVAQLFHTYVHDEGYVQEFANWPEKPELSFLIAGYSSGSRFPEVWELAYTKNGDSRVVCALSPDDCGIQWLGDGEAISRLVFGYGGRLPGILLSEGVEQQKVDNLFSPGGPIRQQMKVTLWSPEMPIQDAIELADFLVHTTARYTQFIPGGATVGGPTEIAALTRHEGFKWVRRKHYFDRELNT